MTDRRLIRNTTIKVRLYPTPAQAELFEKTFGCCRWLWNQMLADQEKFYAETDVHFLPTPAKYKKGAPFLKEVDSGALATVHQNLRKAFQLVHGSTGRGRVNPVQVVSKHNCGGVIARARAYILSLSFVLDLVL